MGLKKAGLIVLLILLVDQVLKFWVKTNMYLGEDIQILGEWFFIHFTENKGMAFGWEFAGKSGKYLFSIFRLLAVVGIGYYLWYITRKNAKPGLIIALSLILAGAMGNIIDSAFYGMIFSESGNYLNQQTAVLFPPGGGYSSFLQGSVVDMFYFPIIQGNFPDWLMNGRSFVFFRPVFNIADASITVGVFMLLIFQKRYFHEHGNEIKTNGDESSKQ